MFARSIEDGGRLPERIGPYRVVRQLGTGSMGIVYHCRDDDLARDVAVKVLRPQYSDEESYRTRFRREARAVASLSHPAVVQIYGIQETAATAGAPPTTYIVMELVDGLSADEILDESGPLDVDRAIAWIRDAAAGLREAAAKNLIHRDVKPSNLLVTPDDHVKIVDFGLAKDIGGAENSLTQEGLVLGTPHYISPEQGRGRKVDHRSDIYSLGATMYHFLTGRPPFEGDSHVSVIVAHVNEATPHPREQRADVPDAVARVVLRMLEKSPAHRYPNYDQLIEDLDAVARGDEPNHAARRPRRPRRGRRVLRWAVGALAAVTLAVTIVSLTLPARDETRALAAAALGPWFTERPDGRVELDVRFATPPPGTPPLEVVRRVLALSSTASVSGVRPELGAGGGSDAEAALSWDESLVEPFAFPFAFDPLERVELWIRQDTGRFDLSLSIVAPDAPAKRELRVRIRPRELRPDAPIEAWRAGVPVRIDDLEVRAFDGLRRAAPLGRGDLGVALDFIPAGGRTRVEVTVRVASRRRRLIVATLEGDDWGRGYPVLQTASTSPYTVALERVRVEGRPAEPFRVENFAWPR